MLHDRRRVKVDYTDIKSNESYALSQLPRTYSAALMLSMLLVCCSLTVACSSLLFCAFHPSIARLRQLILHRLQSSHSSSTVALVIGQLLINTHRAVAVTNSRVVFLSISSRRPNTARARVIVNDSTYDEHGDNEESTQMQDDTFESWIMETPPECLSTRNAGSTKSCEQSSAA